MESCTSETFAVGYIRYAMYRLWTCGIPAFVVVIVAIVAVFAFVAALVAGTAVVLVVAAAVVVAVVVCNAAPELQTVRDTHSSGCSRSSTR